jgi:DNA-binding PadR family transcriptional regulator
MMRDKRMDEVFKEFLPSASEEQIEGARWSILGRVRARVAADRESLGTMRSLNHGDYHILLALADRERHAYGILTDVAGITEGATRFGPGTLYTSISRLLSAGLIEVTGNRPDPRVNDEPREYYRLTQFGQRVLASESERLAEQSWHWRGPQIVRPI